MHSLKNCWFKICNTSNVNGVLHFKIPHAHSSRFIFWAVNKSLSVNSQQKAQRRREAAAGRKPSQGVANFPACTTQQHSELQLIGSFTTQAERAALDDQSWYERHVWSLCWNSEIISVVHVDTEHLPNVSIDLFPSRLEKVQLLWKRALRMLSQYLREQQGGASLGLRLCCFLGQPSVLLAPSQISVLSGGCRRSTLDTQSV